MEVDYNKQTYFRYKLNENWKDTQEAKVNGVHLFKNKWIVSEYRHPQLDLYIRTGLNPNGMVDLEEFNPVTHGIVSSPIKDMKRKVIHYTYDSLITYKRKQLEEVAKAFNINPVNKRNDFLIKLILQEQEEYKVAKEEILNDNAQ